MKIRKGSVVINNALEVAGVVVWRDPYYPNDLAIQDLSGKVHEVCAEDCEVTTRWKAEIYTEKKRLSSLVSRMLKLRQLKGR